MKNSQMNEMIVGDKEAIVKNDVIAKDLNLVLSNQREWAEARKKDNIEALNRHEQQLDETTERSKDLSS